MTENKQPTVIERMPTNREELVTYLLMQTSKINAITGITPLDGLQKQNKALMSLLTSIAAQIPNCNIDFLKLKPTYSEQAEEHFKIHKVLVEEQKASHKFVIEFEREDILYSRLMQKRFELEKYLVENKMWLWGKTATTTTREI